MRGHRLSWAVGCVAVLVLLIAGASRSDASTIEIGFEGSFAAVARGFGFLPADLYQSQGIVFETDIPVMDVAVGRPGFLSTFTPGGGSGNALVLAPNPPTAPGASPSIRAMFVVPGTSTLRQASLVEIDGFDRDVGDILGTIQALDAAGNPFGPVVSLVTPAEEYGTLTLSGPGIWGIEITGGDEDGAYFDNLRFTTVPEPSTWLLLLPALAGIGLARRGRAG